MAVERRFVAVANQGTDQCCVLEISMEQGADPMQSRVLGGCPNEPVGALSKIHSAICAMHIAATDREGVMVLE
jgi:hypothetical protein